MSLVLSDPGGSPSAGAPTELVNYAVSGVR